jgi:hypothetical protein
VESRVCVALRNHAVLFPGECRVPLTPRLLDLNFQHLSLSRLLPQATRICGAIKRDSDKL